MPKLKTSNATFLVIFKHCAKSKRKEEKSSLMNVRVWQFSAKLWPRQSNEVVEQQRPKLH